MYPEGVDDCEYGKEASEVPVVNRRLHSLRYSERSSSVSSMQSDGRPKGNPPLLNEIISILEDINYPVNQQLLNKAEAIKVNTILYLWCLEAFKLGGEREKKSPRIASNYYIGDVFFSLAKIP